MLSFLNKLSMQLLHREQTFVIIFLGAFNKLGGSNFISEGRLDIMKKKDLLISFLILIIILLIVSLMILSIKK